MRLTVKIWRQSGRDATGELKTYQVEDVSPDMSFLEMLDVLNEQLNERDEEPIAYDNVRGYADLAAKVRTPLQMGENLYGPRDLFTFIEAGALHVGISCDVVKM